MYQTTQENTDFLARVASYATKGGRRGLVRDIPLEAIKLFEAELEEMNWAIDAAKTSLETVLVHVRHLKSSQFRLQKNLAVLAKNSEENGLTSGRRKGMLRCMVLHNRAGEAIEELTEIAQKLSRQFKTDAMGMKASRRLNNTDAKVGLGLSDANQRR